MTSQQLIMDLTKLSDSEVSQLRESGTWSEKNAARNEEYRRIEEARKRGRSVGDTIEFVRYGRPVANSKNHRDGTIEDGMSVYMLDGIEVVYVGFCFGIVERPAYRGRGVIVGWGSDGEPLVTVVGRCVRANEFDK